jgi:hypothetical protein
MPVNNHKGLAFIYVCPYTYPCAPYIGTLSRAVRTQILIKAQFGLTQWKLIYVEIYGNISLFHFRRIGPKALFLPVTFPTGHDEKLLSFSNSSDSLMCF